MTIFNLKTNLFSKWGLEPKTLLRIALVAVLLAIVGIAAIFGSPQIVAWIRSMFGV